MRCMLHSTGSRRLWVGCRPSEGTELRAMLSVNNLAMSSVFDEYTCGCDCGYWEVFTRRKEGHQERCQVHLVDSIESLV
jgi:hypothetical protein